MPVRRALVVPVAGASVRFRESAQRDVLKCLYHEGRTEDSLLYFIASYAESAPFDVVRFVGGYQYDRLTATLRQMSAKASRQNLGCIYNPEFETKGTAQTVYLGLRAVLEDPACADVGEIVLLEGDVVGDAATLEALAANPHDVLTTCSEPITARESVVLYKTTTGEFRFAFDPHHRSLTIAGPVQELYNSGQAWKLVDMPRLRHTLSSLTDADLSGTCLVILERYFRQSPAPAIILFDSWVNCNTLADYRRAQPLLRREVSKWTN